MVSLFNLSLVSGMFEAKVISFFFLLGSIFCVLSLPFFKPALFDQ